MELLPHMWGVVYLHLRQTNNDNIEIMLASTIPEQYEGFMKKEEKHATVERQLQGMIGYLSLRDFKGTLHGNIIKNGLVAFNNIKNAFIIFDPNIKGIWLRTVMWKTEKVDTGYVMTPQDIDN